MTMFKFDGVEYDLDKLPESVKQQLNSVQFVDAELANLAAKTAVFQTARINYIKALKDGLDALNADVPLQGETINFG
jgi:hypothetical protein